MPFLVSFLFENAFFTYRLVLPSTIYLENYTLLNRELYFVEFPLTRAVSKLCTRWRYYEM